MTVVLATVCRDGVVIGADTQITDKDKGMSFPAQKLRSLGDRAAWGGSGSRAVLNELNVLFTDAAGAILESPDIARELQERTLPVLRHHYENFIEQVPGEDLQGGPSAYVLAAGVKDGVPWIIEVLPNGMTSHYEDVGFHAIGSGAPMAQQAGTLLAHHRMTERTVDHGVVAVVRVIDALSLTSPSVGGEIDVCRITADSYHHLDEEEVEEARRHVERWRALEQEALDRLFEEG